MNTMEHKNLIIFIITAAIILVIVYFAVLQISYMEDASTANDTSITAIENDLVNTDVDLLDQEFDNIDAELEAAINETQ